MYENLFDTLGSNYWNDILLIIVIEILMMFITQKKHPLRNSMRIKISFLNFQKDDLNILY